MRKLLTVLTICLLPLAGFLAFSPDVPAMPALGDNSRGGMNAAMEDASYAFLDTAGVTYVTTGLYWPDIEYHEGQYTNWPDTYVSRANNMGQKVNFQLVRAPVGSTSDGTGDDAWAHRDDDGNLTACAQEEKADDTPGDDIGFVDNGDNNIAKCPMDPSNLDAYGDFIYKVLDRYDGESGSGQIHSISVENEPNARDFFFEEDHSPDDSYAGDGDDDVTLLEMYQVADSIIDNYFPSIKLVGPEAAGCGFGDPSDGRDPEQGSNWDFTFLEELRGAGVTLDVLATHCYGGWAYNNDASIASYTRKYADSASNHNWTGPIWLSEFGKNGPLSEQEVKEFNELVDSADPEFTRTYYFHWTNPDSNEVHGDRDREVVVLDYFDNLSFHDIKELPYCYLVSRAGNEGQEDRCPDVYDITGHGMGQKVPPLTDCHFSESTTSGSTPYSWEWYQRGCDDCPEGYSGSGSSVTVSTPSSGSFILKVIVTDDNGAQDEYEETYTVESGAMCQT